MSRYRYLDEKGGHVHLLDNQPLIGTSRVGSILAKPLAWYGSGKAVEVFGCPNPKVLTKIKNRKATEEERAELMAALSVQLETIKLLEVEAYFKMVDAAYRNHDTYFRGRAKTGTDLHAECEKFVKRCLFLNKVVSPITVPQIDPFINWTRENVARFLWSEGHCYSEKHWLGGISDCGYETKEGKIGVLDFKSSKDAYMDQFWQCAGYSIQIEENGVLDADGNVLFKLDKPIDEVAIFPFGADTPEPRFHVDMAGAKEAFLAELFIYNKLPRE